MANFLTFSGSGGYLTTPFTLISSELTSLGSSLTAKSANTFNQTSFANGIYGYVWLTVGTSWAPVAGGNITGWWLSSLETAVSSALPQARPPDWLIPLSTAGANAAAVYPSQLVRLPWTTVNAYVQNNCGVTLGSSSTAYSAITCGPVAIQY